MAAFWLLQALVGAHRLTVRERNLHAGAASVGGPRVERFSCPDGPALRGGYGPVSPYRAPRRRLGKPCETRSTPRRLRPRPRRAARRDPRLLGGRLAEHGPPIHHRARGGDAHRRLRGRRHVSAARAGRAGPSRRGEWQAGGQPLARPDRRARDRRWTDRPARGARRHPRGRGLVPALRGVPRPPPHAGETRAPAGVAQRRAGDPGRFEYSLLEPLAAPPRPLLGYQQPLGVRLSLRLPPLPHGRPWGSGRRPWGSSSGWEGSARSLGRSSRARPPEGSAKEGRWSPRWCSADSRA